MLRSTAKPKTALIIDIYRPGMWSLTGLLKDQIISTEFADTEF